MTAAIARKDILEPGRRRAAKSPFYTLLGLAMLAFAVGGFWPQYYRATIGASIDATSRHMLVHVHAAIFLGWLILFVGQAVLILNRKMQLHRRYGPGRRIRVRSGHRHDLPCGVPRDRRVVP